MSNIDIDYIVKCSGCGNNFDEDDIVYCDECSDPVCDECVRFVYHQGFDEVFCKKCFSKYPGQPEYTGSVQQPHKKTSNKITQAFLYGVITGVLICSIMVFIIL